MKLTMDVGKQVSRSRFAREFDEAVDILPDYIDNLITKEVSWKDKRTKRDYTKIFYKQNELPEVHFSNTDVTEVFTKRQLQIDLILSKDKYIEEKGSDSSSEEEIEELDMSKSHASRAISFTEPNSSRYMDPKMKNHIYKQDIPIPAYKAYHLARFFKKSGYTGAYEKFSFDAPIMMGLFGIEEDELFLGSRYPQPGFLRKFLGASGKPPTSVNHQPETLFMMSRRFKIMNARKATNIIKLMKSHPEVALVPGSNALLELWEDSLLTIEIILRTLNNHENLFSDSYSWAETLILMLESSFSAIKDKASWTEKERAIMTCKIGYDWAPDESKTSDKGVVTLMEITGKSDVKGKRLSNVINSYFPNASGQLLRFSEKDPPKLADPLDAVRENTRSVPITEPQVSEEISIPKLKSAPELDDSRFTDTFKPLIQNLMMEIQQENKLLEEYVSGADTFIHTVMDGYYARDTPLSKFRGFLSYSPFVKRRQQYLEDTTQEMRDRARNKLSTIMGIRPPSERNWGLYLAMKLMEINKTHHMTDKQFAFLYGISQSLFMKKDFFEKWYDNHYRQAYDRKLPFLDAIWTYNDPDIIIPKESTPD